MRQYKFRAWHTSAKEMLYEDYPGNSFSWLHQGQPIEIMQFIGLQDAKGSDIYEGDILHWTSYKKDEKYLHIAYINHVDYFAGATQCGYRLRNGSYSKMLTGNRILNASAQIIGNIYENPELIQKSK